MSLLVTGTIGIDTVKTPFGLRENCPGGSAVYFSMAASFFSPVRFVGVMGTDCPFDLTEIFKDRNVNLAGLEIRQNSKTFRWHGSYQGDMNDANTELTELNVIAEEPPKVPKEFKDSQYVFLANTHPALQKQLLLQIDSPEFVVADTMNLWIETEKDALKELLGRIDALILNDAEAKMFTGLHNSTAAAIEILKMGVKMVIVKKGQHGSMAINDKGEIFMLPSFPTVEVKDPTGAGDSFAGAMMGYIASKNKTDINTIAKAMAYGTVIASLNIEGFSLEAISTKTKQEIEDRYAKLKQYTHF